MAIGKRSNAPIITTGGPDVHGTTEEQVEGGEVVGGLGVARAATFTDEELTGYTIDELIFIKRQGKELADTIKANDEVIGKYLMDRMCEDGEMEHTTRNGQWKAQMLIGRTASSVNVKRLVERGVDPDVIKSCTDAGAEYSYIKIVKVKGA